MLVRRHTARYPAYQHQAKFKNYIGSLGVFIALLVHYSVPITGNRTGNSSFATCSPSRCPSYSSLQALLDVLPFFSFPRRAQLAVPSFAATRTQGTWLLPMILSERPPSRNTRCSYTRCALLAAGMEALHALSPPHPSPRVDACNFRAGPFCVSAGPAIARFNSRLPRRPHFFARTKRARHYHRLCVRRSDLSMLVSAQSPQRP